jgi:hypothetical protein
MRNWKIGVCYLSVLATNYAFEQGLSIPNSSFLIPNFLQSPYAAAFITANNVYMGAAMGTLKYTGYQYVGNAEGCAAHWASSP